jgi:hypothetical protein
VRSVGKVSWLVFIGLSVVHLIGDMGLLSVGTPIF